MAQKNTNMLFAILVAFAIVSFWRGVWGLMDVYLLPGNQVMSFIISAALGIAILVFTHYGVRELI